MPGVRLILALHNHQPVGNFDGVFEAAYRDSYLPFLEVMEDYPEIPFVLHTSGPLMEWLVEHRADYVATGPGDGRGGAGRDPRRRVLRADHDDDPAPRPGRADPRLRRLSRASSSAPPIRGMWMPERVWEQHLVSALAEAGVEYTVLDDFHFQRAGLADDGPLRLLPDRGRRPAASRSSPARERLRYTIPFQEPHATYEYLRRLAERAARARPSSSPTTARSSAPGPRPTTTSTPTAGSAGSAT